METIYFPTVHEKDKILYDLFSQVGFHCQVARVDTDVFGTFTGEVERPGSLRQTLEAKIVAARKLHPEGTHFLASEGSFIPHPIFGIVQTDLESLLYLDVKTGNQIYVEHLDPNPVHDEKQLPAGESPKAFLQHLGFPEQGLIVHPKEGLSPICKGIHDWNHLEQAIEQCRKASKSGTVILRTDLRANHNPRRRQAIRKAGEKLIERLASRCPRCQARGFGLVDVLLGVPCSGCGRPSELVLAEIHQCQVCGHSSKVNPDHGQTAIDPAECEWCNP